ncbi:MAG TPA: FAD-linked oxidase C-terminal domain-containing protein [Casimicrobiaceae bacterium]|nr:FAD-linked oxidase C-terminal domain-containing protein [Casimicrobiaceae bacterium]
MLAPAVHAELAALVPPDAFLTAPEDTKPYECDGLTLFRERPSAVVLPETEAQVAGVLRACHGAGIPVVARGAGTSLSGGALPDPRGVVLSMAKFNRILSIDALARTAVVQPGVRNLAISEAAAPHGLYYAPDPSSQIACSIGGNVAENAGGVHCLKYGLTVHNVLRVRALLIDGEAVEFGGRSLDSAGYDLLALVHGSEGLLAVITEITVRLLPKPQSAQVALAAFDDVEKAGAAVGAIIGAGIVPAGLEMMDQPATRAVEEFVHANYPLDAAAVLLVESDGTPEEVAAEMAEIRRVLSAEGATSIRVSRDEKERKLLWSGRKNAFPAVGRISPDYYCIDGTIPRGALPLVLRRTAEWSREFGLPCANVFHAGDGNLHPLILFDASRDGEIEKTIEFGDRILALCIEVGGTVTGEHGVGIEKLSSMCAQFAPDELERFLGVKSAFDPSGLLNPGKAVPTLARCAEFGRMHVHRGELRRPDLERF